MIPSRSTRRTLREVKSEGKLRVVTFIQGNENGDLMRRRAVVYPSQVPGQAGVPAHSTYFVNNDGSYSPADLSDDLELVAVENPREMRSYISTPLPTVHESVPHAERTAILNMLYGEIGSNWRLLTDVRFKLLGLVPTISAVVLIQLLSKDDPLKGLSPISRVAIACFGFLVTLALYIYERRNSELYDDLVSRARKIEEELGIETGQFRGRKRPHPFIRFRLMRRQFEPTFVQHSVALNIVYWSALLGWLVTILLIQSGAI